MTTKLNHILKKIKKMSDSSIDGDGDGDRDGFNGDGISCRICSAVFADYDDRNSHESFFHFSNDVIYILYIIIHTY